MDCGKHLGSVIRATARLLATATVVVVPAAGYAQLATRDGPTSGIGPFQTTVRQAQPQRRAQPEPAVPDDDAVQATPARPALPSGDAADPAAPNPLADVPDDDNRRTVLGRPTVVDGDLNWPPEPPPLRDGAPDQPEADVIADGVSPSQIDTRNPSDIAAFERPPAGFDPGAFVIELDPILDRRPAALYRFEPFQATGIRVGSFTVLPESVFAFSATDNLFRTGTERRGDVALEARPTVRIVSNWRTHALELRGTGITSFHNEFPKEDDRAYQLEARGRLDVSRRTNIEVLGGYELGQESRGSINAGRSLDRVELETTRAGITANHRFNRLAIQLRGTVTEVNYHSVLGEDGFVQSNDFRDSTAKEVAARATWTFKPELGVFAEVAENARDYRVAGIDGIKRDSTGERVRTGVTFGSSGRTVRGEVSVGYGRQRFDDSRLPEIDGVLIDANLAWRVSGLTALLFTARTDVSESQLAGSGGALSRTAALELRHEFGRRLIGTAGLRWTTQDYVGTDVTERELAGLLGLEYYLNREVTLFGRYQHIDFDSNIAGRTYTAEEVRIGVRVRR